MSALLPVIQVGGAFVADSRQIALGLNVHHHNLLANIETHLDAIQQAFGIVLFETEQLSGPGRPEKFAYLTENQALFVATLARNTDAVVRFKSALVTAFDAARRGAPVSELALPQTYAAALRALADTVEEKERLVSTVATLEPKAAFFDAVADSPTAIEMAAVAKVLNFPGIGRTKLFAVLRDWKVLRQDNTPYQQFCDRGFFRVIEQKWHTSQGETRITLKTLVYQKGLDFIRKILLAELNDKEQAAPAATTPTEAAK